MPFYTFMSIFFLMRKILILLVLLLPLLSGCLTDEYVPKEGDLFLEIHMQDTVFSPGPDSMEVTVTLTNNCSETIMVDDCYGIGCTLFPVCVDEYGNEVQLSYPISDREVRYTEFAPDEKHVKVTDLSGMAPYIEKGGDREDFNWEIPGNYTLSFAYSGTREPLEVGSNEIVITIDQE